MQIETKWHGAQFKRAINTDAKNFLLKVGFQIEKQTKLNMASIYDRPQRGSYKRTGAARASVHTIFLENEIACLIGSDSESLNKARVAAGATGSNVFYFRYLEDGYTSRKGRQIQGHHMLKNALDVVKARYR